MIKLLIPLALSLVSCSAQPSPEQKEPPASIANAGNSNCPVSGRPVNGTTTYTHGSTEYNLCSEKCKTQLDQNPERYIVDGK